MVVVVAACVPSGWEWLLVPPFCVGGVCPCSVWWLLWWWLCLALLLLVVVARASLWWWSLISHRGVAYLGGEKEQRNNTKILDMEGKQKHQTNVNAQENERERRIEDLHKEKEQSNNDIFKNCNH